MGYVSEHQNLHVHKISLLIICILLTVAALFALMIEDYFLIKIILVLPLAIYISTYFDKHFMNFFVLSLFVGYYFSWPLQLQPITFISLAIIFYFVSNKTADIFNDFKLPRSIKYSASFLIIAVILSAINSPYFSYYSVNYALGFIIFMSISYITFRYVQDSESIEALFKTLFLGMFIASLLIIFQIILTSKIRSMGITSYPIMDFAASTLAILLIGYFILDKADLKIKIYALITFSILITTLSRFAWLGFILSFIYGLIIVMKYQKKFDLNLKEKYFYMFVLVGFVLLILYLTDSYILIVKRLSEIRFTSLFEPVDDQGNFIANSLELRILIWIVAVNAFLSNPLTGVGYFMFQRVSENYNVLPTYLYDSFVYNADAHTTFLNFLCETGVIGFLSFLIYLIIVYRLSLRSIRYSFGQNEFRVSIILNILVFFVISHSIYSGAFTFGTNAFHMHFIFGLAVGNYVYLKKKYLFNK